MPNSWFRFQQFTVRQDRCAMKVGTDGVLLGAWACTPGVARVLDIGTGTGLLALIAAQRAPQAMVQAVEIDPAAAQQAAANAQASPWGGRIQVHAADIRHWRPSARFDLVLCNPPFYKGHQASADQRLAAAKHEGLLNFGELFAAMARLMAEKGRACVILPADRSGEAAESAEAHGLAMQRRCAVRYVPGKPVKRVLAAFMRVPGMPCAMDELLLHQGDGSFSPRYRALVGDLELHA